jgi:S-adenosylmethionine:tRNA ribosyltransferase-isomerase
MTVCPETVAPETVCPETANPPAGGHHTPAEPDGAPFAGSCRPPASAGPAERRGLARDEVRLLVVGRGRLDHVRFRELGGFLEPGDLVVVNTSATLPAAVDAMRRGRRPAAVHFSTELDDGSWVVELRLPDGSGPMLDGRPGELIRLGGGARLRLLEARDGRRLWRALPAVGGAVTAYLSRHGRPITYGYLRERHPLRDYQTVFATEPGSAEMPSAGRPFSARLVTELVTRGVVLAPITLHTGVSSLEAHEPPQPERFRVPAPTARLVNQTRAAGGRVVAVGTTVTRALESAVTAGGAVEPREGWTDLVLGPDRPAKVVNGLITGWHEPGASHLLLLRAVAGETLVHRAYRAAADHGYLYHEFGDTCLLLP